MITGIPPQPDPSSLQPIPSGCSSMPGKPFYRTQQISILRQPLQPNFDCSPRPHQERCIFTKLPHPVRPTRPFWVGVQKKIFPIFPRNQPVQFVKRPSMAKVRCQSRLLCIIWGEALPNRKNSGSPYFFKPAVVFDDIPFFGSPCVNRYTPTQSPTGWLLIPSKKRVSFYDKNFIINIEFCHKINVGSQRLPCP